MHVPFTVLLIRSHISRAPPLLAVCSPAPPGLWIRAIRETEVEERTPSHCPKTKPEREEFFRKIKEPHQWRKVKEAPNKKRRKENNIITGGVRLREISGNGPEEFRRNRERGHHVLKNHSLSLKLLPLSTCKREAQRCRHPSCTGSCSSSSCYTQKCNILSVSDLFFPTHRLSLSLSYLISSLFVISSSWIVSDKESLDL